MNPMLYCEPQLLCRDNDNDSMIPELWAMEALDVLQSNMVMGNLVHRDYSGLVANFGDVVNARRPVDFKAKRKVDGDNLETQDAQSPNIRVPLDQWLNVSFIIYDGESSKSMSDLFAIYLQPAAKELAEQVDRTLAGQSARLMANVAGRLGEMTKTNSADFVIEADEILNTNRAPQDGRSLIMSPRASALCKSNELFIAADKRGDGGTALESAMLGRVFGFNTFMDQNITLVNPTTTYETIGVTDGAEVAGATVIETDVTFSEVTAGNYVVIEGEGHPHRVSSVADSGGDADITLVDGLANAVEAGAAVTVYRHGLVEVTGADDTLVNYPAGYHKRILVDTYASGKHPQVGQWVTFGTGGSSHSYTITQVDVISATSSKVTLDRPLDAQVNDEASAHLGPAGSFNLALRRDAVALVSRPLAPAPSRTGVSSFVASYNDMSLRVTFTYDGVAQGTRCTVDLLMGTAILDERQAVVLLS